MNRIKSLFLLQRPSIISTYTSIIKAIKAHSGEWESPDFLQLLWDQGSVQEITDTYNRDTASYHAMGIRPTPLLEFESKSNYYDIVFVQMPYLWMSGQDFDFPRLKDFGKLIVFIPYYLTDPTNALIQDPLVKVRLRSFDYIFCQSEYTRAHFMAEDPALRPESLVAIGSPKLDEVDCYSKAQLQESILYKKINNRKTFMWAPHWIATFEMSKAHSSFLFLFAKIFGFFEERKDLFLIFRPHPLLFRQILDWKLMTEDHVALLPRLLAASGNAFFDDNPDGRFSFGLTDALLTDCSSGLMMDFLPTLKPISVFLLPENEYNYENLIFNAADDSADDITIIKYLYYSKTVEGLFAFIDQVTSGHDPKLPDRQKALKEYFLNVGTAGQEIVRFLTDKLRAPRTPIDDREAIIQ